MADAIRKLLKDERQLNQVATSAFMEFDTDKSGFLEEKELLKVMTKACVALNCPKPTSHQIKELLKKIDQHTVGKISFDEYLILIKMILKKHLRNLENESESSAVNTQKTKDEDIEKQVNKQLGLFEKYLEESGISVAFQIIYTEILSKKIDPENVFTYTAMRLRQIGKEIAHLLPSNLTSKLTES